MVSYSKKSTLYLWIFTAWALLMFLFGYYTVRDGIIVTWDQGKPVMAVLEGVNFGVFTNLFLFFSVQNFTYPIMYQHIKNPEAKHERKILAKPLPSDWHPIVKLLYTTYNDFIPYALNECMNQTYDNVKTVILDNSTDQHFINLIRQFCKVHPDVEWVRDVPNHHAKAGNLDNYLCHEGRDTYDYFVILDSDELLQPDFVEKCLKFFYYGNHLGILQCNHISGRNDNAFMDMFAHSGNSFWPVQNSVRSSENGYLAPTKHPQVIKPGDTVDIGLGHGVMVSRKCFDSFGEFPWMVAEDMCSSCEALLKGWNIKFATQIYGNEEFPINMEALMVRSSKFCSANFQFFNRYVRRLFKTKLLTRRQKLDLLSFTLNVPTLALMYMSLILCSIVFPLDRVPMGYNAIMLLPTLLCYFSQSITDGVFEFQDGMPFWDVMKYELESMIMYGSFYYLTVKCTVLALLGVPAKFNVTPKSNTKITYHQAFMENIGSITFSLITIITCIVISRSSWILLSFVPGCLGWLMSLKANHQSKSDKKKQKILSDYNYYALYHPEHVLKWYE